MFLIPRIKKAISVSKDYKIKEVMVDRRTVYLVFNEVLCNTSMINDFILRELVSLNKKELNHIESEIPAANVIPIQEADIFSFVNQGFVALIYRNKIFVREKCFIMY